MIRFTLESDDPPVLLTKAADLPPAPFAAMLTAGADRWRRFRVTAVEERPNGVRALTVRSLVELPREGALGVAAEIAVRIEKITGGFRAFLTDGGGACTSNMLDVAVAQGLFLAELYGCGDLVPGEGIPQSVIDHGILYRQMIKRYSAKRGP